ncbi:hypothetical protein [Shewanella donghaensis]|uniref:hypothetical protein n=1 Tax=Shewanella donghaensis TaxID=238836 RepID=UPI001183678B|nr:hypothetical protein [Shewanella donghaensis]
MIKSKTEKIARLAYLFGLLGLLGLALGIGLSVVIEHLKSNDNYSLLQFSISELGTYNKSSSALLINGGLFFGSLSLTMSALFGLQMSRTITGYFFWLSLIVTFLALAASGLFPLNVYHLHIKAVSIFIYFGLISGLLGIIEAIFFRHEKYWVPLIFACLMVIIHGAILTRPFWGDSLGENPLSEGLLFQAIVSQSPKPHTWWLSILFWSSIMTTWLWMLSLCRWYFLPHRQVDGAHP